MLKKIIALLLCVLMMIPLFSSCAKRDENDMGPMITMYLSDEIYNFDPAYAYYNATTLNIVSMMFETLFKLDGNGKIQNALVDTYEYIENPAKDEYKLVLSLKDTCWSNKDPVTADNVMYAWKRLLNANNSFEAASLLFDIKNARAVKEGDVTIDDLGVEANSSKILTVYFEGPIDLDAFLLNLTSVVTAPLPESHIEKDADWAKKGSTMICSGPFKLGKTRYVNVDSSNFEIAKDSTDKIYCEDDYALDEWNKPIKTTTTEVKKLSYFVLERNNYYYRNPEEDKIDKYVTPHRLLFYCRMSPNALADGAYPTEEVWENTVKLNGIRLENEFKNNFTFYLANIPYALRGNADSTIMQNAKVSDSMSTFSLYLNQNAMVNDGTETGYALFANKDVRKALSLAIDRKAIADAVVFGEAATGLVPNGVFEAGPSKTKLLFFTEKAKMFRDNANNDLISSTADMAAAQALLAGAGITPSNYSFSINVASYDDANIVATRMIADSWRQLGFNVSVKEVQTIQNNDVLKAIANEANNVMTDICDDLFVESITRATFEVVAFDYTAFSADAYSVLSSFAKSFAGMAVDMESENYDINPHRTGYDSKEYNDLMEAIYYVPYFASLNRETDSSFLGIYENKEEFQATYDAVKAVYDKYGITPTTVVDEWKTQKATLLHKAEELLISDLPIIPVLFNQHADVYKGEQLTDITSNYYVPTVFTEAMLENYLDYTYSNKQGKLTSIFASFPIVEWNKIH